MKSASILTILLALIFCVAATSPSSAGKTSSEPYYNWLMDSIHEKPHNRPTNTSNEKAGDKNEYRTIGFRGWPHKALAACLVWNTEAKTVNYSFWRSRGGRDWSNTAFGAVKQCNQTKAQRSMNCKCQLIDHDGENVLKLPNGF